MLMKKPFVYVLTAILGTCVAGTAWAGELIIPNTFESGAKAMASQVNENFSAVATAVNNNLSLTQANTVDNQANIAAIADNSTAIADNGTAIAGNNAAIANIDAVSAGNADAVNTLSDSMMWIEMEVADQGIAINNNAQLLSEHSMTLQGNTASIDTNTTAVLENSNAIGAINALLPQYQPLRILTGGVDIGLFLQAPPGVFGAPIGGLLIGISDTGYLFGIDTFTSRLIDHDVLFMSGDCTGPAYAGRAGRISEFMAATGYVFRASGSPAIGDPGYFIAAGSFAELIIPASKITPDGTCIPLVDDMQYVYPVSQNLPGTTAVSGASMGFPVSIGWP